MLKNQKPKGSATSSNKNSAQEKELITLQKEKENLLTKVSLMQEREVYKNEETFRKQVILQFNTFREEVKEEFEKLNSRLDLEVDEDDTDPKLKEDDEDLDDDEDDEDTEEDLDDDVDEDDLEEVLK